MKSKVLSLVLAISLVALTSVNVFASTAIENDSFTFNIVDSAVCGNDVTDGTQLPTCNETTHSYYTWNVVSKSNEENFNTNAVYTTYNGQKAIKVEGNGMPIELRYYIPVADLMHYGLGSYTYQPKFVLRNPTAEADLVVKPTTGEILGTTLVEYMLGAQCINTLGATRDYAMFYQTNTFANGEAAPTALRYSITAAFGGIRFATPFNGNVSGTVDPGTAKKYSKFFNMERDWSLIGTYVNVKMTGVTAGTTLYLLEAPFVCTVTEGKKVIDMNMKSGEAETLNSDADFTASYSLANVSMFTHHAAVAAYNNVWHKWNGRAFGGTISRGTDGTLEITNTATNTIPPVVYQNLPGFDAEKQYAMQVRMKVDTSATDEDYVLPELYMFAGKGWGTDNWNLKYAEISENDGEYATYTCVFDKGLLKDANSDRSVIGIILANESESFLSIISAGAAKFTIDSIDVYESDAEGNRLVLANAAVTAANLDTDDMPLTYVVAGYNADGSLAGAPVIETKTVAGGTTETFNTDIASFTTYDNVKLFAWKGIGDLVPYCASVNDIISQ